MLINLRKFTAFCRIFSLWTVTMRDARILLGTDHYFFGGGGWKILKKIVCKDKKVQINCLQANEISMQHQPRFNNNEQSASTNIPRVFTPKAL
jgi:hypothetical protein